MARCHGHMYTTLHGTRECQHSWCCWGIVKDIAVSYDAWHCPACCWCLGPYKANASAHSCACNPIPLCLSKLLLLNYKGGCQCLARPLGSCSTVMEGIAVSRCLCSGVKPKTSNALNHVSFQAWTACLACVWSCSCVQKPSDKVCVATSIQPKILQFLAFVLVLVGLSVGSQVVISIEILGLAVRLILVHAAVAPQSTWEPKLRLLPEHHGWYGCFLFSV